MTASRIDAWAGGPPTREHTFPTGRSATLREHCPVSELVRSGVLANDLVEAYKHAILGEAVDDPMVAQRLEDVLVVAMWVDPKITLEQDGHGDAVPISMLDQRELSHTVALALGGPRALDGFPGALPEPPRARSPRRHGVPRPAEQDPAGVDA